MAALHKIRYFQTHAHLLILKAAFACVVRDVSIEQSLSKNFRFQASAIAAIQEAAKSFLINYFTSIFFSLYSIIFITNVIFSAVNLIAIHVKRVTVMLKDS